MVEFLWRAAGIFLPSAINKLNGAVGQCAYDQCGYGFDDGLQVHRVARRWRRMVHWYALQGRFVVNREHDEVSRGQCSSCAKPENC